MSVTRWVLIIRVVNQCLGFGVSFLSVRLDEGGLSAQTVGIVLAFFGLTTIPSRLIGGALAYRYGNRTAAVVGLVAAGLSQLAIAAAQAPALMIASVALLGLAYEVVEPATQAAVADDAHPDQLSGQFSLLWAAISIAGVISGLLAAALSPLGIWSLFVVDGVGSLSAAAVAWHALPRRYRQAEQNPPIRWLSVCTRPLMAWTAIFTLYATEVMIAILMLPLAIHVSRLPEWLPGLVFAISACGALAYQRLIISHVGRHLTPATALVVGHLTLAAGTALWLADTTATYLTGALIQGITGALLTGTYQAIAAAMSPTGSTAKTLAVFGLAWGLASIAAPLTATPLLTLGPGWPWAAVTALSCASAALLILPPVRGLTRSPTTP